MAERHANADWVIIEPVDKVGQPVAPCQSTDSVLVCRKKFFGSLFDHILGVLAAQVTRKGAGAFLVRLGVGRQETAHTVKQLVSELLASGASKSPEFANGLFRVPEVEKQRS